MDNMKYYNDSLAYDFEMFMPHSAEKERPNNMVKLPVAKTARRSERKAAARQVSVSAFAVMTAFFILVALCGNIFLRIEINEVNSRINDVKGMINEIDSEKTSLEMELERRISYSNIELEATELGMHKMDKKQVRYIRVNDKNTAETAEGTIVSEE